MNKIEKFFEIPIIGKIAAGQPIEAIEFGNESISVLSHEIKNKENHYALKVAGNSMIDEGIFDGDTVIIRKQEYADDGQTIVAVIDDNLATLKKIYREKNRVRLQPANPTLFPIYRSEVEIRGIVVKVVRNLEQNSLLLNAPKFLTEEKVEPFVRKDFELDKIYNMDCIEFMKNLKDRLLT